MKAKLVPIKSIKTNPKNPRVIRDEKFQKLVKSIQEFPKMLDLRPIVVNKSMMVLGGNQRLKACIEAGLKEVPILIADELTKAEQERFIITDNVNFGDWDFSDLNANWNLESLENWGLDVPGFDVDPDKMGDEFSLPDGDKAPFQQMTFTLADDQAEQLKNAIDDIKKSEEFKYVETFGNENGNGNALYLMVMQWAEQKK
jgi:ParB-like chromosome segregation protein Spo0J